jgi:hypothetical protein
MRERRSYMKKRTSRKSFMAVLLALAMLLTMIPAAAFAAEEKAAFGVKEVTTLEAGKKYVVATKDKNGNYVALSNEETDGTDIGYSPARVRIGVAIDVEPTFEGTAITKLTFDASKKANMYFNSTSGSGGVYFENPSPSTGASNYRVYITDTGDKGAIKYQNSRIVNYSNKQLYGINESGNTNYYVTLAATADEYGIRFITTKTQSEAAEIIILEVTDDSADPEPEPETVPEVKETAKERITHYVSASSENYYEAAQNELQKLADDYSAQIDKISDTDADGINKVKALYDKFTEAAGNLPTKNVIDLAKELVAGSIASLKTENEYYDVQASFLDGLVPTYQDKLEKITTNNEGDLALEEFAKTASAVPTKANIDQQNKIFDDVKDSAAFATYTKEQQQQILDLIEKYKAEVSKATSNESFAQLAKDFQAGLDEITEASGSAAEAKTKASAEIDKAVSDSNLAKYKDAEQTKIKELAAKYKDAISKAKTADEAKKLLADFNTEVAKLKTAAQIDADTKAQVQKATVSIKKPTAGKKKVTVKWTANKLFDGYQVSYKIKGKKKWKKVTVKGGTKTKKVIKKLKKGKKYQVKVRGYKTISGAKVYSKFSKTKTTKKVK